MSKALEDVAAERRRQIEVEGWTPEHDDEHREGELAQAAAVYALGAAYRAQGFRATNVLRMVTWPWDNAWFKLKDQRRDLVKAGALILAEIERLDRAAERATMERAKP